MVACCNRCHSYDGQELGSKNLVNYLAIDRATPSPTSNSRALSLVLINGKHTQTVKPIAIGQDVATFPTTFASKK